MRGKSFLLLFIMFSSTGTHPVFAQDGPDPPPPWVEAPPVIITMYIYVLALAALILAWYVFFRKKS